ncbi:hypothetical protein [Geobacillus stearothermophilus]|uniref:hypothetical protein n=1 Tax=Geobacillus stearothermophilus TaxID=1422 RepID=UPI002402C6F1|nr:hypothetical protein [Geobacillus stearothermophilus]MDF9296072.1 hypothetical protein [Geobacillus stearothermophilus]
MNDKELLQKIKNVRTAVKEIYGNVNTITYPIYMVDWLIEQAKKAERYEKALKEIAEWSGIASREYRIATKALEDEK